MAEIRVTPANGYTMSQLRGMTALQFAALPRKELLKLYYWYGTGDNWFGVANEAMRPENLRKIMSLPRVVTSTKPKQTLSEIEVSRTMPEITITAPKQSSSSKQLNIAVETDLDPSLIKELATPDKKIIHYSPHEGQKSEIEARHAGDIPAAMVGVPMATTAMAGPFASLGVGSVFSHLMNNPLALGYFTLDGIKNAISDNGVLKTYRIGKDIYNNGLTGQKAWNFAKSATGDILDISGGLGTTLRGINSVKNLNLSGRLRGLYDASKYDIYDRLYGLKIYKQMPSAVEIGKYKPFDPSHNLDVRNILIVNSKRLGNMPLEVSDFLIVHDTPITSGVMETKEFPPYTILSTNMHGDLNSPQTFMLKQGHARSPYWTARSWTVGFSTNPGSTLPKSFAAADRTAIKHAPSGSFISADSHYLTYPEQIEANRAMNNTPVIESLISNRPYISLTEYGMSPDAYRFFTILALKPGNKLVYAGKAGKFNDYAVRNSHIYDLLTQYENGEITAKQFVDKFNDWSKEFGGRPAHVDFKTGKPYIYQPVIYKEKLGGKLNYAKYFT